MPKQIPKECEGVSRVKGGYGRRAMCLMAFTNSGGWVGNMSKNELGVGRIRRAAGP